MGSITGVIYYDFGAGPAAKTQDADRSADTAPTQIEQVPRQTQEVFMPPPSTYALMTDCNVCAE